MRPFELQQVATAAEAVRACSIQASAPDLRPRYLAGGTNLLDLMKLDVMQPGRLVNIMPLRTQMSAIQSNETGLRLGALAHMSEVADHEEVRRRYPALSQSLSMAASPQLRNMATLGGNVLQRTRCNYFRDRKWAGCNKRSPGSGCAAISGVNRRLAILGVSDQCIATYPGDFANALIAFGAEVTLMKSDGSTRTIPFDQLHRLPADRPDLETTMVQGELITEFFVPAGRWTRRSLYLKIRDRESYDFALASAAVGLDMAGGTIRSARIGLGGVATVPWRAGDAEALLQGKALTETTARAAAEAAFATAIAHGESAFKVELGKRTLVRALVAAAAMEVDDE